MSAEPAPPRGSPPLSTHRPWADFLGLVVAAFVVRFVYLLEARSCPLFGGLVVDAESYWTWSEKIVHGDWIGDRVFYQAPLYPYWLALVKLAVGSDLWRVRLVQIACGALACGFLYLAGRKLVSRRAGLAAGVLLALYPSAIFFDTCIQKAGFGLVWTSLLLLVLAHVRERIHARACFALGVVLGLLMLTREETILLVPVLVAWLFVAYRQVLLVKRMAWLASSAAGLALVVLPVAYRNFRVGGEFVLSTSQAGSNFYIGNGPHADGTYVPLVPGRHNTEFERQDAFELAAKEAGRELSPREVSDFWLAKTFDSIRSEPARWIGLLGRKLALLVNAFELPDAEDLYFYARYSRVLRALEVVWNFGLLVPLAAAGLALTWPRRRTLAALYVVLATLAGGVVLFYVFARYRYPIVPVLILFAGAGIVEAFDRARAGRYRSLAVPALVFALFWLASNAWRPYSRDAMLPDSLDNAGIAQAQNGHHAEAVELFREAARAKPRSPEIWGNLGVSLMSLGRFDEAAEAFQRALDQHPADTARGELRVGWALGQVGRFADALTHLDRSIALAPRTREARLYRSMALQGLGRWSEAAKEIQAALELDAGNVEMRSRLAWILATAPADDARDGARSLALASPLASDLDPITLDVLAAAQAECGRFDDAVATLTRSLAAARERAPALVGGMQARLEIYRAHRPYRQGRPETSGTRGK